MASTEGGRDEQLDLTQSLLSGKHKITDNKTRHFLRKVQTGAGGPPGGEPSYADG